MNSDFSDLLRALNEEAVEYLIVGGYAVIKYTEPRFTKDIDIWVNATPENAERVVRALTRFGAPLVGVTREDFANVELIYQIGMAPTRIDIIMGVDGLEFSDCWPRREVINWDKVETNFISIRDLIANKEKVGRPQDLIDLDNLRTAIRLSEREGDDEEDRISTN
jgi:hypothetical protein